MCPSILIIMHILLFSLSVVIAAGTAFFPDGSPCSSMAPETVGERLPLPLDSLLMEHGYFQTQAKIPGQTEFVPDELRETSTDGVLYVDGRLRTGDPYWLPTRQPYFTSRSFHLTGFWSRADGKLCMFDFSTSTTTSFHSVLKLDFKSSPTILTSLISGTLESLDVGRNHFDPIDILGYNQNRYNYTLASRAGDPPRAEEEERGLSLGSESSGKMCSIMRLLGRKVRIWKQRFGAKLHGIPPQKLWNISYAIRFSSTTTNSKWIEFLSFQTSETSNYDNYRKIYAEGVYNSGTGLLCMVGCRYLPTNFRNLSAEFDRHDCEISINVQFPPAASDPSYETYLNGSIRSRRDQSDPLYFQPLVVTSRFYYSARFRRMAKRMDFEFVMVVVSLTLTCVCVASQLLYAKRRPEALPSVSVSMLGVLALGLMVPLVLNFEALFVGKNASRRRRSAAAMLRTGGWLEAKEVAVRALTMVAFLLQSRLLQLTVSAKSARQGWWSPEGRVLKWCIALYSAGGLIALLLHFQKSEPHRSLWEYMLSYAGLVLDGFLLPQVLLSLFSRSEGKALAVPFYVGMTLVRSLPHAYDAYRARYYRARFRDSYLYADHRRDFYSAAWDVVIPCGGAVLSVLTFVQQKFGGSSIVPPRFRSLAGYEAVPGADGAGSASEVELQ